MPLPDAKGGSEVGSVYCRLQHAELGDVLKVAKASPSNDSPAMHEMVRRFNPLAQRIARSLTACTELREDLANAARTALPRAVRRHELERPGFPSYAEKFMRGAAIRELQRWTDTADASVCGAPVTLVALEDMTTCEEEKLAVTPDFGSGSVWGDGDVDRAVSNLSPSASQLLYRRHVEDATLRDLAAASGTSQSAVSQRLGTIHRAVARLIAA